VKKEEFEEEERKRREEEKQKTTVHEERIEKKEVSKEETKIEEALTIPILKLEKPSFETYSLKLNVEVPEVKKEETVVSVPFINLQERPSVLIEQKFNDRMASVKQEKTLPTVPILRLETLTKVQVIQKFNEEIREIKGERIEPLVPFYNVEQFSLPKYLGSFNLNVLTISRVKPSKEETKIEKVEVKEEKVATKEAGVPSGGEEEIPDFLKLSFGSEGGKIRGKGPKIILFKDVEDDSYIDFLENVCLRVYREIEGGEPEAVEIKKIDDDLNKREIERWLDADGKIFTINLDEVKIGEIDETHLWERLEETYSSKLGFIIFATRSKEKFETFKKLLQTINLKSQGRLNIAYIEAKSLSLDLIKLSSGVIDLPELIAKMEIGGVPTLSTFDYIFNEALFKESSYFEEIKNEENGLFKLATTRNKGQIEGKKEESDLHYNIKVFIVRYLVNKLRKEGKQLRTLEEIKSIIKTEEESKGIIPDVQVNNEFYEVETLFGEGVDADKKIDETINKYTNEEKVNIVMDNFGFLLHLKDLERRKRHYKNVEFYTLDLKNKELVSIEEFEKELRKILAKQQS